MVGRMNVLLTPSTLGKSLLFDSRKWGMFPCKGSRPSGVVVFLLLVYSYDFSFFQFTPNLLHLVPIVHNHINIGEREIGNTILIGIELNDRLFIKIMDMGIAVPASIINSYGIERGTKFASDSALWHINERRLRRCYG